MSNDRQSIASHGVSHYDTLKDAAIQSVTSKSFEQYETSRELVDSVLAEYGTHAENVLNESDAKQLARMITSPEFEEKHGDALHNIIVSMEYFQAMNGLINLARRDEKVIPIDAASNMDAYLFVRQRCLEKLTERVTQTGKSQKYMSLDDFIPLVFESGWPFKIITHDDAQGTETLMMKDFDRNRFSSDVSSLIHGLTIMCPVRPSQVGITVKRVVEYLSHNPFIERVYDSERPHVIYFANGYAIPSVNGYEYFPYTAFTFRQFSTRVQYQPDPDGFIRYSERDPAGVVQRNGWLTMDEYLDSVTDSVFERKYDLVRYLLDVAAGYNSESTVLILKGPGGSGKSMFIRLAERFAPSHVSTEFSGNDFETGDFPDATLVTVADTDDRAVFPAAAVKKLVSPDTKTGNKKYENLRYYSRPLCLIFSTNADTLRFTAHDTGMQRRLLAVQFPVSFRSSLRDGERQVDVASMIDNPEWLSYALAWCMRFITKHRKQGYYNYDWEYIEESLRGHKFVDVVTDQQRQHGLFRGEKLATHMTSFAKYCIDKYWHRVLGEDMGSTVSSKTAKRGLADISARFPVLGYIPEKDEENKSVRVRRFSFIKNYVGYENEQEFIDTYFGGESDCDEYLELTGDLVSDDGRAQNHELKDTVFVYDEGYDTLRTEEKYREARSVRPVNGREPFAGLYKVSQRRICHMLTGPGVGYITKHLVDVPDVDVSFETVADELTRRVETEYDDLAGVECDAQGDFLEDPLVVALSKVLDEVAESHVKILPPRAMIDFADRVLDVARIICRKKDVTSYYEPRHERFVSLPLSQGAVVLNEMLSSLSIECERN